MKNVTLTKEAFKDTHYLSKAAGWINDVFHQKKVTISNTQNHLKIQDQLYCIHSRITKETEETGFGIYYYEETAQYENTLSNGLYIVDIVLANPTSESYHTYIRINGIIKEDNILVEPNEEKHIRIFTSVLNNKLTIKFLHGDSETHNDSASEGQIYLKAISISQAEPKKKKEKPSIYLASDSTVMDYDETFFPQTGWGQMLPEYIESDINNFAIGGRSSSSFIAENRLDRILEAICPGDYLFVQFGHNDATKTRPNRYVPADAFPLYIQQYIEGCHLAGAQCVLVTPVARRNCDDHGEFRISFNDYRQKIFQLAKIHHLPVLDLGLMSTAFLRTLTPEESKEYYMWVEPGAYDNERYDNGLQDNTHINKKGATVFAELLIRLILNYCDDSSLDYVKDLIHSEALVHTKSLDQYDTSLPL